MSTLRAATAIIICAGMLAGCSGGHSAKSGQVVAKVNGDELTVHQLNFMLSQLGNVNEAQAKDAGKQLLDSMVDQQLFMHKAVEDKLDRDPQVALALEASRRQILSSAYLERKVFTDAKPQANEVHAYYVAHPELFAQRRVYRFGELSFEAKPDTMNGIKAQLEAHKSLPDVGRWLREQNIPFKADDVVKPAEQVPTQLLAKIKDLKPGQIIVLPAGANAVILQLMAAQEQAVAEDQAKPSIEAALSNQKRMQLAEAEVKQLRGASKIEYLGPFAKNNVVVTTKPSVEVEKKDTGKTSDVLDKGIKGF